MTSLSYAPKREFDRIRALPASPERRAELFAALCRINTLYMIMRAGSGHIGTSFSSLDIMSWIFLQELKVADDSAGATEDIFFSSKGHDAPAQYAVMLALGLLDFDLLHQLRRLGGLPGHPDVGTPHIVANTGSLGMGISKARGMVLAHRLQQRGGRVFVMTGDGELQEGQFWESLQPTANRKMGEITVIVDHNKVQSDTWVSAVSDLGRLEDKLRAFGWHVARCDGHDQHALQQVFAEFATITEQPKILIADTVKGRGVSFMEHTAMQPTDRLYRYHSGAPDDATYARAADELIAHANELLAAQGAPELELETAPRPERLTVDSPQRMVPAYAQALVEQADRNPRVVALDADLALDTGLLPFEERFPDRFFECGIAEQDMVSQAGGMARQGLLPIVHSFACFLSDRPNEQIYNNATERTKTIYVGSLAGLLPGGPGHSHQCVRDIAALSAVPGLDLIEPSCEAEVAAAVDYCINGSEASAYLRLVSIPCAVPYQLPEGYRLTFGQGVTLREGDDAVLFGYGPVMLPEAYRAAEILAAEHGISLKVVNLPWLNRVDPTWLRATIANFPRIFTLDNHYVDGGQGAFLAGQIAELGLPHAPTVQRFGVRRIPLCGQNDEVLRAHELDASSLARHIAQLSQPAASAKVR